MSKFIGTIIDKSYFDFFKKNDNLYQICYSCGEPRLLRDKDGLTRGKKHYCKDDKLYWAYGNQLTDNGFIFIPAKKIK